MQLKMTINIYKIKLYKQFIIYTNFSKPIENIGSVCHVTLTYESQSGDMVKEPG